MPQWTDDQKSVINASEKRVICSAAAGSGKTAVMVERIVRLIREGADCLSFLVITFTNMAAAEMREKIRKRLLEERSDPRIVSAAEKAGIMEICTIHSFCQHLLRQEFQAAGIDPQFKICNQAQREKMFQEAFRQACDRLKEEKDPDYLAFTQKYEPKAAQEIVLKVYDFMMSLPHPLEWLWNRAENVPLDFDRTHPWFVTVAAMLKEQMVTCRMLLRRQLEMFDEYERVEAYRKIFLSDKKIVDALERWIAGNDAERTELEQSFARMPSCRNLNDREIDWKERYGNLRKQLKEECESMQALILTDREKMKRELSDIHQSLRGLAVLTEYTYRSLEQIKRMSAVLDFSDLEHKTLAVLEDTEEVASVRERYRYIFVDECQDVSAIQDALVQKLAGDDHDLFMVGDVKQSIYRFRQARPALFLKRMKEKREGQVCLHLQENFRSRPEILHTANLIFRDLMRPEISAITYQPEDELYPGRKKESGHVPVEILLTAPETGMSAIKAAAVRTADEIEKLLQSGKTAYRDIVILMPEVSTDGPILTEYLKEREIPVIFDGQADYFQQPEVDAFRSLLSLLDNPRQDLPLLSVLRNPIFRMPEEELAQIRLVKTGKDVPFWQAFQEAAAQKDQLGDHCRIILQKLEKWRFQAKHQPLGDFCWYLMEESGLYAVYGATEHGTSAQKNIRSFCIQAVRAQQNGSGTLRDFLDHLTEQEAAGETRAASLLGDEDNVVRIMTIHKSKGLQFPVVFCLGLDRKLIGNHPSQVMLDEELGICLHYKIPKYRLSRATSAESVFQWKSSRQVKEEKICLLYVAVTRAQERLYLIGSETDHMLWHLPQGESRVLSADTYLDWIMPALMDAEKQSTDCSQPINPYEIRVSEKNEQPFVEKSKVFHNLQNWLDSLLSTPPVEELWKKEEDSHRDKETEIMKKTSVSALLQSARNRIFMDDEQNPEEKRTPDYVEKMMKRFETESRPAFMREAKEKNGAERGTAVHRFLSLVDLRQIRDPKERMAALTGMKQKMEKEQVFTREEASWIRLDQISRFFDSDIGKRMLASEEVHREWDFNLFLSERQMMLQGMIDCAFMENGKWVLLDYKTDRIDSEADFVEEYRPQLAWYRTALEQLTGKPVKESWLYSLSNGKPYQV